MKKISVIKVDATNVEELAQIIKNVDPDVVISAIGPFFEFSEKTTRASIEAGYNYVNICDDHNGTQKILELNSLAEKTNYSYQRNGLDSRNK